jgi:hypothetical protein
MSALKTAVREIRRHTPPPSYRAAEQLFDLFQLNPDAERIIWTDGMTALSSPAGAEDPAEPGIYDIVKLTASDAVTEPSGHRFPAAENLIEATRRDATPITTGQGYHLTANNVGQVAGFIQREVMMHLVPTYTPNRPPIPDPQRLIAALRAMRAVQYPQTYITAAVTPTGTLLLESTSGVHVIIAPMT